MATVGSITIPTNSSMMICRQPGTKVSACSDDLPSICQENTMDLVQAARLFQVHCISFVFSHASVASHPYPFVSVIVFWSSHRNFVYKSRRFFICFLSLLKMIWDKKSIPQQNWWPGYKDRGWQPGVFLHFVFFWISEKQISRFAQLARWLEIWYW